ncbi:hypothetical protein HDU98_001678 [Podochytrium sp. JEL0797]|nr:hypothetical protein HDU98_001678 [Podochytrium sp. JEL0797]
MPSLLKSICFLASALMVSSTEVRTPPTDLEITTTHPIPAPSCPHPIQIRDTIGIRYKAWSYTHNYREGTITKSEKHFDRSPTSKPFEYMVGRKSMEIPGGLHDGVVGACVGESRTIVMPAEFGFLPDPVYGYSSAPKAPYGSVLEYRLQIVNVNGNEEVAVEQHTEL